MTPSRHQKGGRRGVVPERGLYTPHACKARQEWHFLDPRVGAQCVVPERGLYTLHADRARQAWHILDSMGRSAMCGP
eukprot:4034600-Pyramimonas_sp.AAC.1